MVTIQIGVIIFLLFILLIVYQDEYRKRILGRKSVKLSSFWNRNKELEERRRSVRTNAEIDVSYEVLSGNAVQKRSSMSRNISLGGINLALNEKLLPETTLQLQLNIPKSHRPIFTQGKIAWVREISEKFTRQKKQRVFATGIKFTQINPRDEAALNNFIKGRIKNAY